MVNHLMNDMEIILPESPEAAQRITVTGWVSRQGQFFGGDEETARYAGSTHRRCRDCAAICAKSRVFCDPCQEKRAIAAYHAAEKRPWADGTPIYAEATDTYYESPEYAQDDLEEGQTLADLRLYLCMPVYARAVDTDHWEDELAEDDDLPTALATALDALNRVIATLPPLSYLPSKVALDLRETEEAHASNA